MMKKLLTLLLLSPLAFAEEETKQNICYAKAYKIIESGLAPCKENDILNHQEVLNELSKRKLMMRICKRGTNDGNTCILRAEKDFAGEVDHSKANK